MLHRLAVAGAVVLFASLGCGGGMRFQAVDLEHPTEQDGAMPPPVADQDFHPCYSGHAEGLDTTGDGRVDYVRVRDDGGHDVCHGVDSDHDGNIDQWDVMGQNGKVRKRARDTDHDGHADEQWSFDPMSRCATIMRDTNGDGQVDGNPVDTCPPGTTAPSSAPAPAPAPAPSPAPPTAASSAAATPAAH
jgi:hypothetical protein